MRKFILLFCATLGVTSTAWAEQNSVDPARGPTIEEYQAAMVVVRRYLADQKAAAEEEFESEESDELSVASREDENQEGDVTRELINPGFRVFGGANVEAATVTAIAADGNDGTLVVGNTALNQTFSGRLMFDEDTDDAGLCGMQFRYDGTLNTMRLEGGCSSTGPYVPKITIPRSGPTLFYESIGIGGSFFNGGGGGGFLMVSFHANGSLSCDNVCASHEMGCDHSMVYSYSGSTVNVCSNVPSGDFTWAACACSN